MKKLIEQFFKKVNKTLTLALILSLLTNFAIGQTPGNIFAPSGTPVIALDPDGDGDIVANGSSFSSVDEYNEFEGEWTKGYQNASEPSGDNGGGSCGTSDVVDAGNNQSAYYIGIYDPDGYPTNENGNEYFLFRLRVAKDPGNSNFGYSILIDSDNQYGSNDPNRVSGNDGFEYEIRLTNGGGSKGIYVDDVDGTTSGTKISSYSYSSNHIKSYANSSSPNCTNNDPVFVDVAVPYVDLPFNPSKPIRIAAATSGNGTSVLNGNGKDVAGLDDGNFTDQAAALKNLISNQSGTSLPVELTNFKASVLNNQASLTWRTASETNNRHFIVQKRIANQWHPIGTVEGNGTTTRGHSYSFSDLDYQQGATAYYRLKQVDFDGSYEYSDIKSVRTEESTSQSLNLYPVPASDFLQLGVFVDQAQTMQLLIRNMDGKEVYRKNKAFPQGQSSHTISLAGFEPGAYLLHIPALGPDHQKRFIKN